MNRPLNLVALLVALCAASGVAADAPDSWHAWKTFKSFARMVEEVPDPGVSVQVFERCDGTESLAFVRQVLDGEDNWLEPIGGVVWELSFPGKVPDPPSAELWSFDYPSMDAFVDAVEQDEVISRLLLHRATSAAVYWQEA